MNASSATNRDTPALTGTQGAIGVLLNDFQLGGCERVAIRLANAWHSMGIRVILYVASDQGSLRAQVSRGVEVIPAEPPICSSPWQSLKLGWWAGRRMRADGVTRCLLPGNSQFDGALPVVIATCNQVPVFAKVSNPLWRTDRSWLGNAMFRLLTRIRLAGVSGLAALSPRLLRHDDTAIGFGNRGRVQPDALGARWPQTQAVARRPFHLCAAGRLAPQKNFALLLRSLALLRDLPITLTIVGDGEQMQELRALARQLAISDRVYFAGAVADCTAFMAEAEALVSTSRYEGYPAVLVEALAVGTFVISSRSSCAMEDIIQSPLLGRIVEDARPAAIAMAIREFLASPERLEVRARRDLAHAIFSANLDAHSAREYLEFMNVE
jgi:glycosyltransferase involved in cell wall biosynthesis